MRKREPYVGDRRRLVLAFDLGTTYSGISYSILDPGNVPEIHGVNRYPAQESVGGDCKIPSVIYYDENGKPRAFGAEALEPSVVEKATDNGWTKVEWFKLHLRPKSMRALNHFVLPSLPGNKSAQDVYADYYHYLFDCAHKYICDNHGELLWDVVKGHIHFVLSHPNGWSGPQQKIMRSAAIAGKLIPDNEEGRSRLKFVTEGEASLNHCINQGLFTSRLQNALVVDAGGGTVDLSVYSVSLRSMKCEELVAAQCVFQGSIFVTRRAETFFKDEFSGSKFADDVPQMAEAFDKTTKLGFRDETVPSYVKFGRLSDHDRERNVRNGSLKIPGSRVVGFFKPSFDAIMDAIVAQLSEVKAKGRAMSAVYLVGGFAASDWLFRSLKEDLGGLGISLCRPENHMNKAVANGGISFHLDRFVTSRVARFTYGIGCNTLYNPEDPEHRGRHSYVSFDGEKYVSDVFSAILRQGTVVQGNTKFASEYRKGDSERNASSLNKISSTIFEVYHDSHDPPKWIDSSLDAFKFACVVKSDTRGAPKTWKTGPLGRYCEIRLKVILILGLTELKAQICWTENGREVRGPAEVVYED
ncbi:hypothetical protein BDV98DRAFT_556293 [Pterulicium gracile]|uniref:Actin-like ATPase domain-containing protein n=1 Tax=Pterulicium gracile TaxID=1884261 RepID=A0A5C3Q3F7_9AGAR|nr:hypothetical protein BDV98DRAFT_556293 [Pterula gracilis]